MTTEQEPVELGPDDAPPPWPQRARVLGELGVLWLVTLLAIRLVTIVQAWIPAFGVAGFQLRDLVLAAVPFCFIYAPVYLCQWRGADSYAYRVAIPALDDRDAWRRAGSLAGAIILLTLVPYVVGFHLYQNFAAALLDATGRIRDADDVARLVGHLARLDFLGPDPWRTLTTTLQPRWRLPEDAALLLPYHLFYVALPEEFFYRGYFQTRLNEVFPRRWRVFGAQLGPGLVIASLFFAFGHSLVTLRWWHFATFFPGLVFGWMRERTGGTAAGALFHAYANISVSLLNAAWLG